MTKDEFVNCLILLLHADIRMKWCSMNEKDGVWEHDLTKCPKCVALKIIKLSTGKDLQL